MVRNGLGVDARGGTVRAASASGASTRVVLEESPFADTGESLRVALVAARANFGEPDAIALVHDDDVTEAGLEQLRRDAQAAGVGEVRLVAVSVARPYAEREDVPPALVVAAGAAIWLLRQRRGVVLPPLLPQPIDQAEDGGAKMDDFGEGRRMADFGSGSTMSEHGSGRSMDGFGEGRTMAAFGAGAQMADFEETQPRRRRSRLLLAALAAAIVVIAGAVAAIALTGGPDEVDSVASTGTTGKKAAAPSTTSADNGVERGDRTTLEPAATTTTNAPTTTSVVGGSGTTLTTSAGVTTTTAASSSTRSYDVTAVVESYAVDPPMPARLTRGQRAIGTVTLTCGQDQSCAGKLTVPEWNFTQDFSGTLSGGTLVSSTTETRSEPCTQPVTFTFDFTGDFTDTAASGQASRTATPRTCDSADGSTAHFEDMTVSFGP